MFQIIMILFLVLSIFLLLPKFAQHSKYKSILWTVTVVYMIGFLYFTLLSREPNEEAVVRLVPLHALKRALRIDAGFIGMIKNLLTEGVGGVIQTTEPLKGIVLNILLFIPFGYLLPELLPDMKLWRIILIAFGVSLAIEFIQLLTGLGWFDVDDLINNTIGGCLGVWGHRKFFGTNIKN